MHKEIHVVLGDDIVTEVMRGRIRRNDDLPGVRNGRRNIGQEEDHLLIVLKEGSITDIEFVLHQNQIIDITMTTMVGVVGEDRFRDGLSTGKEALGGSCKESEISGGSMGRVRFRKS